MRKKVVMGLVLLLAGMFLFVACGQAAEPTENVPDETETENRDVWISLWGIEEKLDPSADTRFLDYAYDLYYSQYYASMGASLWSTVVSDVSIPEDHDDLRRLSRPYILAQGGEKDALDSNPGVRKTLLLFDNRFVYYSPIEFNEEHLLFRWMQPELFFNANEEMEYMKLGDDIASLNNNDSQEWMAGWMARRDLILDLESRIGDVERLMELKEAVALWENDYQGWIAVRDSLIDLQSRIGDFNTLNVDVRSVEPVTWSDASLGVPEPGIMYTQALVEGHRVIFELDGIVYEYHTSPQHVVLAVQTPEEDEI